MEHNVNEMTDGMKDLRVGNLTGGKSLPPGREKG
jgi:hypothetical protein